MPTPEDRLRDLGLTLPAAPAPVASYVPWTRAGALVFTSGQLPMRDGQLTAVGRAGVELTTAQAAEAARQAALNALAHLAAAAGGLSGVRRILKLTVFVSSGEGFTQQPQVANGASELLVAVFGEAGRHARSAVGAAALPLGAPVEVELIAEVAA